MPPGPRISTSPIPEVIQVKRHASVIATLNPRCCAELLEASDRVVTTLAQRLQAIEPGIWITAIVDGFDVMHDGCGR
jgi:hypothetical protein